MRYFLLMCLARFIVVQALGPDAAFGRVAGDQFRKSSGAAGAAGVHLRRQFVSHRCWIRWSCRSGNCVTSSRPCLSALCCLPMIFALLPPRTIPVVYPPYYPPDIQQIAGWMKPNELMMSDVPWAVAWYGQRQCVWLTLNAQDDFFAINDYLKPVQALYLTPETMDAKFASDWCGPASTVGAISFFKRWRRIKFPPAFPCATRRPGFLPERLFLTDCGTLETGEMNSAPVKFTPPRAAAGRRCPTIPAFPAALPPQSFPRPPRRSDAIPRKSPAQTPPRRAESRSRRAKFSPEGICVCAMMWQVEG